MSKDQKVKLSFKNSFFNIPGNAKSTRTENNK